MGIQRALMWCGLLWYAQIAWAAALKPYEQWWEQHAGTSHMQLLDYIQNYNAQSRRMMRQYIKKKGYASILDAGCGSGIDWLGFFHDGIVIDYQGIDITPSLVLAGQKIANITEGSVEQLPFGNNSFDIAYARHVLEHLSSYEQALSELIRVACKEVLIVFFIRPHQQDKDFINLIRYNRMLLYNNHYSKKKLEAYVKRNLKVSYCAWEACGSEEEFLHVYLKN